jgi:hypothetical protein
MARINISMNSNARTKAVNAPQSPAVMAGADLRALGLLLTRP